jgi:hypothetical protein
VLTLLIAYGGIAAVTLSQLSPGSILGFPGLITSHLPSVGLISPPSGGASGPGTGPGGGSGPGSGQYQGTHHLVSTVTPVKLRVRAASVSAGQS